jgi:DNA helicase-2/ATP-dependent DNA helicase PcrA
MNDAQRAAATADIAAPLLIVAGAGSGKTLTMVRRIEHIIKVYFKVRRTFVFP